MRTDPGSATAASSLQDNEADGVAAVIVADDDRGPARLTAIDIEVRGSTIETAGKNSDAARGTHAGLGDIEFELPNSAIRTTEFGAEGADADHHGAGDLRLAVRGAPSRQGVAEPGMYSALSARAVTETSATTSCHLMAAIVLPNRDFPRTGACLQHGDMITIC